ncbi:hypothetical protein [Streptomyces sp. NBC_00280]|uniref:hypothetical protein n=1 Tax=Streptomyces sp. NBC_00280 TaxID=2975699 RepID=UPI00325451AD
MTITVRTKTTGAVLGASAVAATLLLVPLGGDPDEREPGRRVVLSDTKEAVPSGSATDWVSYGDQVAVVRVTAEHEQRDSGDADEGGEEYLPRSVNLRIEERVWERSGASTLPDSISVTVDGWQAKGTGRIRVGSDNTSRLEVGHDYLIAFARFSDGVWSPLGSGGVLPYDNNRVGEGEFEGEVVTVDAYRSVMRRQLVVGEEEPMAFRAAGQPTSGVRKLLRGTAPDPEIAQYFDLDAVARHEKVAGVADTPDTFCSVASPLTVSEKSRYTPNELASVLTDLAAMTSKSVAPSLHSYAASLQTGDGTSATVDNSARKASITTIERECGTEVGELLSNDTDSME